MVRVWYWYGIGMVYCTAPSAPFHRQATKRPLNHPKWREMRAAKQVTRPELVNKLLLAINKLIEQVNTSEDPQYVAQLSDKLSKLSTTIERLDKKTNVTTFIETFIAFGKWLEYRSQTDSALTPELLKTINKYQDLFIAEKIGASR